MTAISQAINIFISASTLKEYICPNQECPSQSMIGGHSSPKSGLCPYCGRKLKSNKSRRR